MVVVPAATTGDQWSPRPVPEDFANTYQLTDNTNDGLTAMSADWIIKNMPELSNLDFAMHAPGCMSNAIVVAAQAVGDGLTNTCLVLKTWNNLSGRYGHGAGANALDLSPGSAQWTHPWGWGAAALSYAYNFDQYCRKYGGNHDMMAPFIVNNRRNGLMMPEGFWYQHRPEPLTVEDYLASRWVAKPANLFDCDIPIQIAVAYLFTTPDRAKDMKQPPVYIMNHATTRPKVRGSVQTLDQVEASTDSTAKKLYEGSGYSPSDIHLENCYEGYSLFHQYYLEALQWHGVQRGEALQFYGGISESRDLILFPLAVVMQVVEELAHGCIRILFSNYKVELVIDRLKLRQKQLFQGALPLGVVILPYGVRIQISVSSRICDWD